MKENDISKIVNDKEKLRKILTKEQFHITQEQGTEAPVAGKLLKIVKLGVYKKQKVLRLEPDDI